MVEDYGGKQKLELYRDSIHGDVELDSLAIKIINTPEFQRLDGLKQLGFADLVFRGAKHSRFLHSIGVYHVARRILEEFKHNHRRFELDFPAGEFSSVLGGGDTLERVRAWQIPETLLDNLQVILGAVGLLHDVTHVPFGHALEDEFTHMYERHDSLLSPRLYHIMFDKSSEIHKIFEEKEQHVAGLENEKLLRLIFLILKFKQDINPEGFVTGFDSELAAAREEVNRRGVDDEAVTKSLEILEGSYPEFAEAKLFHPFMTDIVSNTICADILDYLPRDAHGSGLEISVDARIYKYFVVVRDSIKKQLHLALRIMGDRGFPRHDAMDSVIEIMRSRHRLAQTVYYHRDKVSADVMMAKALSAVERPTDGSPYKNGEKSILRLTDADLLHLTDGEQGLPLLQMVGARQLYKVSFTIPTEFNPPFLKQILLNKFRGEKAVSAVSSFENGISRLLYPDVGKPSALPMALLFCPPDKPQAKEVDTWVQITDDKIMPIKLLPAIAGEIAELNEKYKRMWNFYVFVNPQISENDLANILIMKRFAEEVGIDYRRLAPYARVKQTFLELVSGEFTKWKDEHRLKDYGFDSEVEERVRQSLVRELGSSEISQHFEILSTNGIRRGFDKKYYEICMIISLERTVRDQNERKKLLKIGMESFEKDFLPRYERWILEHPEAKRGSKEPPHEGFFAGEIERAKSKKG